MSLCDPMDYSLLDSFVLGILQEKYQRGQPFPFPGELSDPGIESRSPALHVNSFPSEPPGKPDKAQIRKIFYHVCLFPPLSQLLMREKAEILQWFWVRGFPSWLRWERICLRYRRSGFDPGVGKIPWRREWQPTRVFLPGEFHGQGRQNAAVHGVAKSQTQLKTFIHLFTVLGSES